MNYGPIARRYAKALFLLAQEEKNLDSIALEMEQLSQIVQTHAELLPALSNRQYRLLDRQNLVKELSRTLSLSETMSKFLQLLLSKERFSIFQDSAREFKSLVDALGGVVRIDVTFAAKTADQFQDRIKALLSQKVKGKILISEKVNPDLIGGLVIRQGGILYDGSVKNEMQRIRKKLMGEASQ